MNRRAEKLVSEGLERLKKQAAAYGPAEADSTLSVSGEKLEQVFDRLTARLSGNYPFHHPVYAGQMMKPPHFVAWAAYALAMSINPNNHALDGGPPTSEMEKETIRELAAFFGYGEKYLGHLTAGGTIANLEALWIAREIHPGKKIAFSENAHYTHSRMCEVLGVETETISVQTDGSFDFSGIDFSEIGTMVVTMGTTGLGDVEPLQQVVSLAKKHGFRIHIDSAYGGFFRVLKDSDLLEGTPWQLMQEADSIVVDPHKHGLQPYGCGSVLFKDPAVGKYYKHDSPYTYFTSEELHLGEISLECSRAGAAAAAFWATLQCFPLKKEEGFGPILEKCRKAALRAYDLIEAGTKLKAYKAPELDILAYFPAGDTIKTTAQISAASHKVFDAGMRDNSFFLSLFKIPAEKFTALHPEYKADTGYVTVLRSVFMKPEHYDFVPELIRRIEAAC